MRFFAPLSILLTLFLSACGKGEGGLSELQGHWVSESDNLVALTLNGGTVVQEFVDEDNPSEGIKWDDRRQVGEIQHIGGSKYELSVRTEFQQVTMEIEILKRDADHFAISFVVGSFGEITQEFKRVTSNELTAYKAKGKEGLKGLMNELDGAWKLKSIHEYYGGRMTRERMAADIPDREEEKSEDRKFYVYHPKKLLFLQTREIVFNDGQFKTQSTLSPFSRKVRFSTTEATGADHRSLRFNAVVRRDNMLDLIEAYGDDGFKIIYSFTR